MGRLVQPESPVAPALVTLIVLFLFVFKVLATHGWDPRALVLQRLEQVPLAQGWGIGYDGQWAYRIASDPATAWQELDSPAYRYQRILFPLLARALSLGQIGLLPWAMIALNLAAGSLGAAALGGLLVRQGVTPWLALVFSLSLGSLLAVRLDLLELLALALALWGWLCYERDRTLPAIVLFALGGLTKEIALVFPLGLAAGELARVNPRRALALAVGALAPYLAWYVVLQIIFPTTQAEIAQGRPLLVPFAGLRYLENPASRGLVGLWVVGPALLAGLAAAWDAWRDLTGERGRHALLLLAQAGLIATLPALTWADPLAMVRTGLGFLACLLVWLAASHRRLLPYAAALWLPSGFIVFLVPGMM
jgi:hypothetical protein